MEIADDLLSLPDFEPSETVWACRWQDVYTQKVQMVCKLYRAKEGSSAFEGIICTLRAEKSIESDSSGNLGY